MPIPPIDTGDDVDLDGRRLSTVESFMEFLRSKGGVIQEAVLTDLLDGASERLNAIRQFYPSEGTRQIHVGGSQFAALPDLDLTQECTVLADGAELSSTDLRWLRRHTHPAHAVVLYRDAHELEITGHWGWPAVPTGIAIACREWASRAYFQRQSRQADVVTNIEAGTEDRYFTRMPSSVYAALQPYRLVSL